MGPPTYEWSHPGQGLVVSRSPASRLRANQDSQTPLPDAAYIPHVLPPYRVRPSCYGVLQNGPRCGTRPMIYESVKRAALEDQIFFQKMSSACLTLTTTSNSPERLENKATHEPRLHHPRELRSSLELLQGLSICSSNSCIAMPAYLVKSPLLTAPDIKTRVEKPPAATLGLQYLR